MMRVEVPRAQRRFAASRAGGDMPPPAILEGRAAQPGRLPRKVLVVDDERDLADLAEALLRSFGLDAAVAYSAGEALRILACDPDIEAVFSDIMMPDMTGLQLADEVARRYPAVTVVLTSGFTSPALLAGHAQPFRYVPKPYRIEAVMKLLRD